MRHPFSSNPLVVPGAGRWVPRHPAGHVPSTRQNARDTHVWAEDGWNSVRKSTGAQRPEIGSPTCYASEAFAPCGEWRLGATSPKFPFWREEPYVGGRFVCETCPAGVGSQLGLDRRRNGVACDPESQGTRWGPIRAPPLWLPCFGEDSSDTSVGFRAADPTTFSGIDQVG